MNFMFVKNPVKKPGGFDVPVGGIVLWYGNALDVPAGWEIYHTGKNVFIMGASAGNMNTTVAGASSHTHTIDGTSVAAAHSHTSSGIVGNSTSDDEGYGTTPYSAATTKHTHPGASATFTAAGGHGHSVGNTYAVTNIRVFFRLYWIRRIEE